MRNLSCLALIGLFSVAAHAGTPNCEIPPFGASEQQYEAYEKKLGSLVDASHFFPAICRAKFEHGDRRGLYLLGLTDKEIDTKSMGDLGILALEGMKRLADQTPDDPPEQNGIYAPFTCTKATGDCYPPDDPAYTFSSRIECEQYIRAAHLADPSKPVYMHCFFRPSPWQP